MKQKFRLERDDKWLLIFGPCEMNIAIDFDDVDHEAVMQEAKTLVRLLNNNWKSEDTL